ncbi:MAG: hypothetical protein JWR44_516 [Hymenobacter sp.]|jgi:PKD repeat protein|nr:hypothetical protein [Hymenobacter sp.]
MSPFLRHAALLALTGAALLTACRKDDPTGLEGPVPTADFTVALNTNQFPVVATFTNNSTDAFLYQWDFGDGSPLASGKNVTHVYRSSGTFKAKLIAAGKGGSGTSPTRDVVVPSVCGNAAFAVLTACGGSGSTSWTFDSQAGAITRFAANGTTILSQSAAPLPACQADDQFSFTSTFTYSYDAAAGTYSGTTCGTALSGNTDFNYIPNGNLGRIVLLRKGAFLGTPDSVVNKTYDIVEATPTRLRLQGTLPDGTKLQVTYMPQLSVLDRTKQLLTGGSSRTWMLDNAAQAVITVGTEAQPTAYYPGGPANSLPTCQADDEYTFTSANVLNYNAFAETFVAGSPGTCQAPRTYSSPFTFGPASGTGIAQFELGRAGSFIGVTDAPDLVYRILSIDNQTMVLRAGRPTAAVVFTIKLRVK